MEIAIAGLTLAISILGVVFSIVAFQIADAIKDLAQAAEAVKRTLEQYHNENQQ